MSFVEVVLLIGGAWIGAAFIATGTLVWWSRRSRRNQPRVVRRVDDQSVRLVRPRKLTAPHRSRVGR